MNRLHRILLLGLLWCGGPRGLAEDTNHVPALSLVASAQVDGEGVFLDQVLTANPSAPWPHTRVTNAPPLAQPLALTRQQVQTALRQAMPEIGTNQWTGPDLVHITRRTRMLQETELREWLTATLQRDQVRDKGELELRFGRPWKAIAVPDEPLTLKVLDFPTGTVPSYVILRFDLATAKETCASHQMPATIKIWRETYVTRAAIVRGQALGPDDLEPSRVDVVQNRGAVSEIDWKAGPYESAESLMAGAVLNVRSIRPRSVMARGQVVEGFVREGAMVISLKVEVLENGAPGQLIRVRNVQTRRELKGKVLDENSVQVLL